MARGPLKMPTVMPSQHQFSMVPRATIERSVFDRSHGYKTTFNAGLLIPFYVDEVLPGDTFHLKAHLLCRLSTPIKPVMDNMYVETFFFFVPYRLVWTNFVKFMGEQEPGSFTVYTVPQGVPPAGGYSVGSVPDYMGLPPSITNGGGTGWTHSALPIRSYYLIYNTWFRDENLIASQGFSTGDGPDAYAANGPQVLKRGKRHDYFTSCLPWPQKGTAVSVPLGSTANVYVGSGSTAIGVGVTQALSGTPHFLNNVGVNDIEAVAGTGGSQLFADLSSATAATINSLRQAFQIQKFLERDARGGTRYTEKVRAHFGVVSPDARLQRPEYLGGGSSPMNVTPVPQQAPFAVGSAPPNNTVIGTLSGFGTAFASGHGFAKSFTEHGVIIGLVNVRADLTYAQGMERFWSRSTIYDFYWPSFAHLGEQSVLNKEIFLADNAAQNALTFGYQERYAEYRYKPSRVTGLFRPYVANTLAVWNLSENFGALPTLNQTFIEDQTTQVLDRVLAVNSEPDIIMDSYIELKCARPMPVYSVPGLIDHF